MDMVNLSLSLHMDVMNFHILLDVVCLTKGLMKLTFVNVAQGGGGGSMFVLLYWPLLMEPRQHDRFVLIGLCWLYGRSEFPPPPPPPHHRPLLAV